MNILIWAPHGVGEHYSGPGISAYRLYKTGLPKDVNLYLAHGSNDQKHYPDLFKEQFFISSLDKMTKFEQIKFLYRSKRWINKMINQFDVVHVLGLYEISFRPATWMRNKNMPVFIKLTGAKGGLRENSRISKLLGISGNRKKNLNKISGFIANSNDIQETLEHYDVLNEKIIRIPNGTNTNVFYPVDKQEKKILRDETDVKDVLTILFVGGVSKRKRPMWIAQSIDYLVNELNVKDVQFIMVGPDRSTDGEVVRIKQFIKRKNLENHFYYFEHTHEPQKFYQLSDIYVLTSESEGMSNALLEAMACGLPSIVTPISGSTDLINDGYNGYYVTSQKELTKSIKKYIDDEKLLELHSQRALNTILKGYTSQKVLSDHIALFKKYAE